MPVNPYLNFDGNCREAVEYYARVFGTEAPKFMTFGEGPSDPNYPMPDDARNRIMHSRILVGGTEVMFSDTWPGAPFVAGNNVSLSVTSTERDEITRWFEALKRDGTVQMELQETFWSKAYGSLRDRYGVEWQFNLDSGETF
jgi:PhnB protein